MNEFFCSEKAEEVKLKENPAFYQFAVQWRLFRDSVLIILIIPQAMIRMESL